MMFLLRSTHVSHGQKNQNWKKTEDLPLVLVSAFAQLFSGENTYQNALGGNFKRRFFSAERKKQDAEKGSASERRKELLKKEEKTGEGESVGTNAKEKRRKSSVWKVMERDSNAKGKEQEP